MVEVTLALGIIAFALLAIVGLLPIGLNSSRDASSDTQTSLILQDIHARVRGSINRGVYFDGTFAHVPLSSGPTPAATPIPLPSPWVASGGNQTITWFYDKDGLYRAEATSSDFSKAFYRVDVTFADNWHPSTTILPVPDTEFLRPVVVTISAPVNPSTGTVLNANLSRTFSFNIRKP